MVVLCATRGHFDRRLLDRAPAPGGRNRHYSNPTVWRNLDTVREDEMRRSVALLGVRVLRMLDYAEEGLSAVPFDELVGRIVEPIRMHRPEVILTFGPDGVTGDDDHAAIGRATEAAFERAGDEATFDIILCDTRSGVNFLHSDFRAAVSDPFVFSACAVDFSGDQSGDQPDAGSDRRQENTDRAGCGGISHGCCLAGLGLIRAG